MAHSQAPFVVISQPRTGSTLLCSLLNSVPGIRALVEPVNHRMHDHHMKPMKGSRCLLPEVMIQNNIDKALDILFDVDPPPKRWILSDKPAPAAAGFKIMIHQINGLKCEQQFWESLHARKVKIIMCFRYNILFQYISDLITMATRQPACWDGNVRREKVVVDLSTLGSVLRKITSDKNKMISFIKKSDFPMKRLRYEQFRDNYNPVVNTVEWLIGEKYDLSTKLVKQNSNDLKDRVVNYDELVDAINKLGLPHLLTDD